SHQPNRKMGGIASSSNGLLSRHRPTSVLDYALPGRVGGRGVLLARFGEGDDSLTVAIAHLSLGAQSRGSQVDFLAELLGDAKHVVLMGDFNCGHDAPEVQRLFKRTRLQPPEHTPLTFPSWKPVRALDHILCSESLQPGKLQAMPVGRSDHLAVELQVKIPAHLESIIAVDAA
ncbi:MAG: endonuclease/exonuclease/phosphatase family protein, partial [Lysobacteraceae bacterium]